MKPAHMKSASMKPDRLKHASIKRCALLLLLLLPLVAAAAPRDDYARQWPLALAAADEGAYRVMLDGAVYRQAQSPQMQDVVIVNADGMPVPASLFGPDQVLAQPPREIAVPWFPLSLENASLDRDISTISEIASDGSLRRVQMRQAGEGASEYVIDLSRVPEPVLALIVDWAPGQAPFERRFGIAASDDLKDWSMIAVDVRLLELENDGQRLVEHRMVLPSPIRARYLRLMPRRGEPPLQLSAVRAQLPPRLADVAWRWEALAGKPVVEQGVAGFEYALQGRFPMQRADVLLSGNHSSRWTLSSRDTADAPWRAASAPWLAYQVAGGAAASRSSPQSLRAALRDRYWRLVPTNAMQGAAPTLRLGYQPEAMVFLAEGAAPYALLAGSGRATREPAALPALVDALRQQRGQDWQPAAATLGEPQTLAGDSALTPAAVERDWKAWLLWALLIGGALIVAGFAISLLRKPVTHP